MREDWVDCPNCNGYGKGPISVCSICNGDGKVSKRKHDYWQKKFDDGNLRFALHFIKTMARAYNLPTGDQSERP